jgi:hypothetical protein
MTDSAKAALKSTITKCIAGIALLEKEIAAYKVAVKSKLSALENDAKRLKDEIFQLNTDLPKQQALEIAKAKPYYDQKKQEANQSATAATAELAGARKVYAEKVSRYKLQNQQYLDLVVAECNRMLTASQETGCSVFNEIRFMVAGNWSQVFPCVNALTTMAKPYGTNVFNAYCPGKSSATYMAAYKSFLTGLNADDKEAVKGNSNAAWFDLITQ